MGASVTQSKMRCYTTVSGMPLNTCGYNAPAKPALTIRPTLVSFSDQGMALLSYLCCRSKIGSVWYLSNNIGTPHIYITKLFWGKKNCLCFLKLQIYLWFYLINFATWGFCMQIFSIFHYALDAHSVISLNSALRTLPMSSPLFCVGECIKLFDLSRNRVDKLLWTFAQNARIYQ